MNNIKQSWVVYDKAEDRDRSLLHYAKGSEIESRYSSLSGRLNRGKLPLCGQNVNDPVAEWLRNKMIKEKERQTKAGEERKRREKEAAEVARRREQAQQAYTRWVVKKRREEELRAEGTAPDTAEAEYRREVSRAAVGQWLERKARAGRGSRAPATPGLALALEACRLSQERAWQRAFSVGIYMRRAGESADTHLGRLRRLRGRRFPLKRKPTIFRKDSISSGFVYLSYRNESVVPRRISNASRELFKNFVSWK